MTLPVKQPVAGDIMEQVLLKGDIGKLTPSERVQYYGEVCKSIGLNPLTKPFDYIILNGKMQLYALRACTDQLRKVNNVSLEIVSREVSDDILTIHVRAKLPDGRSDEDLGAVAFPPTLKGEARANMELKAVTKAKRRATLSICGLGWLDETEVADIPASAKRPARPAPNAMIEHDPKGEAAIDQDGQSSRGPEPAATESPSESGALQPRPEGGEVPTYESYLENWMAIVSEATNAAQLAEAWNGQKELRNKILWPDDASRIALAKKVGDAIAFLKVPA